MPTDKLTDEERAAVERRKVYLADPSGDPCKTWRHGDFEFGHATAAHDAIVLANLALRLLAPSDDAEPVDEVYYIQNLQAGYVGNNPMFWAEGGNGYTSYIDKAQKFTKDEAIKMLLHDSRKWRAWPAALICQCTYRTVESQQLNRLASLVPPPFEQSKALNLPLAKGGE